MRAGLAGFCCLGAGGGASADLEEQLLGSLLTHTTAGSKATLTSRTRSKLLAERRLLSEVLRDSVAGDAAQSAKEDEMEFQRLAHYFVYVSTIATRNARKASPIMQMLPLTRRGRNASARERAVPSEMLPHALDSARSPSQPG